jgi:hypothetical protein
MTSKCSHLWVHLDTLIKNGGIFEKEFCCNCDKKRTRTIVKPDPQRDKVGK